MWTAENRARYDRSRLRYPSDLTDEEWALIVPCIPPAKRGGNKRTVDLREIVNGLMYVLSTGCQWRAIPKDLPPRSTLYDYFDLWSWDGTLDRIHYALYIECRERAERETSPTAAIIDSQSVKSAEKGGLAIRMAMMRARKSRAKTAYSRRHTRPPDARHRACRGHPGSRWRRPCHGHLVRPLSLPAEALRRWRIQGPGFQAGLRSVLKRVNLEIVKRSDQARRFVVLPKRWIVERTFAWLGRCRRLAKDWECFNQKALAFLKLASIRLMLRKLCNLK